MRKRFDLSARGFSTYLWSVVALTLVGIVLRTVNMFLFFDYDINYYFADAALPKITAAFFVLATVYLIAVCVGASEPPFSADGAERGVAIKLSGFLCSLGFVLTASSTLDVVSVIPSPVLTTLLYISAVYFLLSLMRETRGAQALTSVAVVLSLASLMAITYFDAFIQMNSPLKVHFHLAMLSSMIFITAEARAMIGMIKRKFYLFSLSIAVFFTGISSVPALAATYFGTLDYSRTPIYYLCDILTFTLFIYFLCRLISLNFIRKSEEDPTNELTEEDNDITTTEEEQI